MRGAHATLREEIEKRFPDYVNLIDPRPIVPAEAQAMLKPGQALIATYVAEDKTYVWALRHQGRVAFAAASLGSADINAQVAALRRALDPNADSLAQIPAFDVVGAEPPLRRPAAPGGVRLEGRYGVTRTLRSSRSQKRFGSHRGGVGYVSHVVLLRPIGEVERRVGSARRPMLCVPIIESGEVVVTPVEVQEAVAERPQQLFEVN